MKYLKKIILNSIYFYKKVISPILYQLFGVGCRYKPTCSDYSTEAIERYGVFHGSMLTIKRLRRCHPLANHSYFDPVP